MRRVIVLAIAVLLIAAPAARAQIAGGNIYGSVTDQNGGVLPGVSVEASSTSTTVGSSIRPSEEEYP